MIPDAEEHDRQMAGILMRASYHRQAKRIHPRRWYE